MTKAEIRAWVRQALAVGVPLLKQWDDEKDTDWHGYIGEAVGALRAAWDALNAADPSTLPPAEEDRQAPWVCLGCSLVFPVCPDTNAYDCPACGEKITPARLWHRKLRCEGLAEHLCGILAAERTGTDMVCTCGIPYRQHPHCANSKLPESMASLLRPEYFLHVICNGRHVKL